MFARKASTNETSTVNKVRVWDLPTRIFHWCFVALFLNAWFTFEYRELLIDDQLDWHRINGYAILVLIVFRLLWGIWGSSTSRFTEFVRGPRAVLDYFWALLRNDPHPYLGHNPLGTGMVLMLLAAMTTQAMFGLFTLEHNETVAGPLKRFLSDPAVEFVSRWHRRGFNLIGLLVLVHISANLFYTFVKRDPLIKAMVTGTKPSHDYIDGNEAVNAPRPMLRAALTLALALMIVLGTLWALAPGHKLI